MRRGSTIVCWVVWLGCGQSSPEPAQAEAEAGEHHHEAGEHHHEAEGPADHVEVAPEVAERIGLRVETVEAKPWVHALELPGEIVADPTRSAKVSPRVSGVVQTVHVQVGDPVKTGRALATVSTPELGGLRSARVALQAKAAAARSNAERLAGLADKRMASQQEVVAARAEADALAAEARGAEQQLRALGNARRSAAGVTFDVLAPRDGVVLSLPVLPGQPVTPETVLATTSDLSNVWFLVRVPQHRLRDVAVDAAAEVSIEALGEPGYRGTVTHIAHQTDEGARTISVRIPLSDEDGRLRLGLFGRARIEIAGGSPEPVVSIPRSAITIIDERTVVFVERAAGTFDVRDVTLGATTPARAVVEHGLRAGERVVIDGAYNLKSIALAGTFGHHDE